MIAVYQVLADIGHKESFIIASFFSSLASRTDFVYYIDYLSRGMSIGLEESGCDFPSSLDEYLVSQDLGFNGVKFYEFDNEITVDVPTFRKYLRLACEAYWQEHPESKEILQKYLVRPQPPLEEGALEEWKRRRDAGEYPKPYSEFE